ncbi:MAG: hypothetical protein BAA03_08035 [Caldibacillus debilis]|nr:MAG: hypothetical protein BAA03_08035 [Caldibacillus debilis]
MKGKGWHRTVRNRRMPASAGLKRPSAEGTGSSFKRCGIPSAGGRHAPARSGTGIPAGKRDSFWEKEKTARRTLRFPLIRD